MMRRNVMKFRDTLCVDERPTFEDSVDECRRHAAATGTACFRIKAEGMFLTILFAHHMSLKEQRDRVKRINYLRGQSHRAGGRTNDSDPNESYQSAGA